MQRETRRKVVPKRFQDFELTGSKVKKHKPSHDPPQRVEPASVPTAVQTSATNSSSVSGVPSHVPRDELPQQIHPRELTYQSLATKPVRQVPLSPPSTPPRRSSPAASSPPSPSPAAAAASELDPPPASDHQRLEIAKEVLADAKEEVADKTSPNPLPIHPSQISGPPRSEDWKKLNKRLHDLWSNKSAESKDFTGSFSGLSSFRLALNHEIGLKISDHDLGEFMQTWPVFMTHLQRRKRWKRRYMQVRVNLNLNFPPLFQFPALL